MNAGFELIEKEIRERVIDELNKVGVLYRIFTRAKDDKSISEKIQRKANEGKPYIQGTKLIQDVIGIRIVTYFKDDVELVKEILNHKIKIISQEVDQPDPTVFKPKRTNFICSFNERQKQIFLDVQQSSNNPDHELLDATYELQLRTILSEGWHEVDHSLRYKCKSDWEGHQENERLLNGIYASLEINDIALKNLFNELSYKHFKNKKWEGLIRNKFRLGFQQIPMRKELVDIFDQNKETSKAFYKLSRHDTLLILYRLDISLPVTINNLIYLINASIIKDADILAITPTVVLDTIQD